MSFAQSVRRRKPFYCSGASMTQQNFKQECDVNVIMRRALEGQAVTHVQRAQGSFEDLTRFPGSYQEALDYVLDARTAFEALPARVRKEFSNDPAGFVALVDKADRGSEDAVELLTELGLLKPPREAVAEPPEPVLPAEGGNPPTG